MKKSKVSLRIDLDLIMDLGGKVEKDFVNYDNPEKEDELVELLSNVKLVKTEEGILLKLDDERLEDADVISKEVMSVDKM